MTMGLYKEKVESNFTMVPNEVILSKELSSHAKVIYMYMASKPEGWNVYNTDIQKSLGIKSKNSMAKYFKELLNGGWIKREKQKSEQGIFNGGFYYYLFNEPSIEEKPTINSTEVVNNDTHTKTIPISNTEKNTYKGSSKKNTINVLRKKKKSFDYEALRMTKSMYDYAYERGFEDDGIFFEFEKFISFYGSIGRVPYDWEYAFRAWILKQLK